MARRRRRRLNPRNAKGHFVKRATSKRRRRRRAKAVVHRRRRRRRAKAKANPSPIRRRRRRARANPTHRRRRRRARANPTHRRRRRRARANPGSPRRRLRRNSARTGIRHQQIAIKRGLGAKYRRRRLSKAQKRAIAKATRASKAARRRGGKRRRRRMSKSMRWVRSFRVKGKKRSIGRAVSSVQRRRASVLRRLGPKRANKSAVAKAMHLRTNPGLAGVLASAKVLVPQGVAATVGALGLGLIGSKLANMLIGQPDAPAGTPTPAEAATTKGLGSVFSPGSPGAVVAPYLPAISTLLVTGVALVAMDKVAPKYKGAVALGGILAAIMQGVAASPLGASGPIADAKAALGLGDYTMIGQRGYAEAGIFRNVGDYTMIGTGGDNATEFARDSLRGADDNTEFAPGEGGLLSGGMFRGPSSR